MSALLGYKLSPEQEAVVTDNGRAIVVVASAGSGKTEVVARRVERLLTESAGSAFRILALSYTVKAADELRQRFREHLGDLHRRVDTTTLHGFAHSLLRQHGTRIGLPVEPEVLSRDEDRAELLARWLGSEGRSFPDEFSTVFQQLDLARARDGSAFLLEEWNQALASAGALDYASMLDRARELLGLPSAQRQLARLYAHVVVDEAQNLTAAQYALLTALIGQSTEQHVPAMLVGDDKQSIVSFAGADPKLLTKFAKEYHATRFVIRRNFRSAGKIVALGNQVAAQLGQPPAKPHEKVEYAASGIVELCETADEGTEGTLIADWVQRILQHGIPSGALAAGESGAVRPEDVAVLARSAAALSWTRKALEVSGHEPVMSSSPEDWLSTAAGKVAYELIALRSAATHRSTHWQLSRLLEATESAVSSPDDLADVLRSHDDVSLRLLSPLCRIGSPSEFMAALQQLEMPAHGSEQLTAAWEADSRQLIDAWSGFVQQTDLVERTWGNLRLHISRLQRGDDLQPGVRLLTIHRAQGREYRAVAVLGLNDGQLPDFRALYDHDREAELRTFYVAVTRPSRLLLLTRARTRKTRYGLRKTDPSPYLQFLKGVV